MVTGLHIRTGRRAVRIAPRPKKGQVAPSTSAHYSVLGEPSVVDLVKASEHLLRMIGAPEHGREKHLDKDLLRMVATFLLDSGRGYPGAEVLELFRCFTGCDQEAAEQALQLLLLHEVVTQVNGVIRGTW